MYLAGLPKFMPGRRHSYSWYQNLIYSFFIVFFLPSSIKFNSDTYMNQSDTPLSIASRFFRQCQLHQKSNHSVYQRCPKPDHPVFFLSTDSRANFLDSRVTTEGKIVQRQVTWSDERENQKVMQIIIYESDMFCKIHHVILRDNFVFWARHRSCFRFLLIELLIELSLLSLHSSQSNQPSS